MIAATILALIILGLYLWCMVNWEDVMKKGLGIDDCPRIEDREEGEDPGYLPENEDYCNKLHEDM